MPPIYIDTVPFLSTHLFLTSVFFSETLIETTEYTKPVYIKGVLKPSMKNCRYNFFFIQNLFF